MTGATMRRAIILAAMLSLTACVAVPETRTETDPDTGEKTEVPTGDVTYEPDAETAEEVATVVAPFLPPPFNIILPGLAAISAGIRVSKAGDDK